MKETITKLTHPSMFAWSKKYSINYEKILDNLNNGLEDGKLEFKNNYDFKYELPYIKYPYSDIDDFSVSNTNIMFLINSAINITDVFCCWCSPILLSFKGFPKKVDNYVYVYNYDEQYSLKHKELDKYKLYLAIWLELFDSVTEEERWKYINEYKGKIDGGYSIIPNEILNEFGVL